MFGIAQNQQFLEELGIANLSDDVKAPLIQGLEETAERKLVIKLSDKLSDEQAKGFEAIKDETEQKAWLQKTLPDFFFLVAEVLDEMKAEILAQKDQVVG